MDDLGARPIAITGLGVVSSIAYGFDDFAQALMRGESGHRAITVIDVQSFPNKIGCEVPASSPSTVDSTDEVRGGRAARFAVSAARMALGQAFGGQSGVGRRSGLVSIGTSDGGAHELDTLTEQYLSGRVPGLDRSLLPRVPAHQIAVSVADQLALPRVELLTNGAACSAGNQAIGLAIDAIRVDGIDFAICGGADALCRRMFAAFSRLNLMAPDLCRPFDSRRRGLLLGEGAAVLVLEDAAKARARGAVIYAEIVGYATNCDGEHPVRPNELGIAECMRMAHQEAGIAPEQVDMISAHGTGTPVNDVVEARAIKSVFGEKTPKVTAIKSMIGHTMGAAGAMGALACVAAIQHQRIPPTINHETTDQSCEIDCVTNRSRAAAVTYTQNNSLGFFGNNAVVMIKRPGDSAGLERATR